MKKDVKERAIVLASQFGGAMAAIIATNIVAGAVKPKVEAAPTRNEQLKKAGAHGLLALLSGAGCFTIDGKDNLSKAGQAASLVGLSVNGFEAVSALLNSSETVQSKLAADTKINRIIKDGFGLKCPCKQPVFLNGYKPQPRKLHTGKGMRNPFAEQPKGDMFGGEPRSIAA